MSKQADAQYFADRAAMERALTKAAADRRAAAVHAELAERYDELALGLNAGTVIRFPASAEPRLASAR